jgi:hypothetical protein
MNKVNLWRRRGVWVWALLGAAGMVSSEITGVAAESNVSSAAITAEQRARIKQHVTAEGRSAAVVASSFSPEVGAALPQGVKLYWMPPEAGVNRYRYVIVGRRTLIVEASTRRVIEILE